jgi:hypothetical protein
MITDSIRLPDGLSIWIPGSLRDGTRLVLRTEVKGVCGKVFQAVGVALPRTVRQAPPRPSLDVEQEAPV